jgi:hypothetical protein
MMHRSRYVSSLRGPSSLQPPLFLQYAIMAMGASVDAAHESLVVPLHRRARALADGDEMKVRSIRLSAFLSC